MSNGGTRGIQRPLKLVTVTHFYPAHGGGLELVALRLVEEFNRCGAEVCWFSSNTDPAPPDIQNQVQHVPVPTWNIIERLTQLPYPLWSPAVIPRLWRAIGAADAVHIHEHLYASSILALIVARLRGKPAILTQHMGALGLPSPVLTGMYEFGARLLGQLLFPLAAHSVFISANVQQFFRQDANPRSTLIFNGIDTACFNPGNVERELVRRRLGVPYGSKSVLFVGRWVRKKGLHIVQLMAKSRPDVFWMIAGSGPENPAVWQLPNVRAYGRIDHSELADYYRAADLLVLPSSGEGFPLVVQEALCCGTGVLSTDEVAGACPPASQMIRTCPTPRSQTSQDGWIQALDLTLSDEPYLNARDHRSQTAHTLWSWQDCAQSYLDILNQASRPK